MHYKGNGWWELHLPCPKAPGSFTYSYAIISDSGETPLTEWGQSRRVELQDVNKDITLVDSWRTPKAPENAFYSKAFSGLIFKPNVYPGPEKIKETAKKTLRFEIDCPYVDEGQRLCLLGNTNELGNWQYEQALLMYKNENNHRWFVDVEMDLWEPIEYKYGLYLTDHQQVIGLETGNNRRLELPKFAAHTDIVVKSDEYFKHPGGYWKGAGVAVPVFSLRSKDGLGTGEFQDIKKMVDWAVATGLKMVQILPVNDTSATGTWRDSYPYSGISVFALHPLYLNIEAIGNLTKADRERYLSVKEELNALADVDYDRVMKHKLDFARRLFNADKGKFLKTPAFMAFFNEHKEWLKPFASFCYLRDLHQTADCNKWTKGNTCSKQLIEELTNEQSKAFQAISFHYFLQFHLDQQLKAATAYARENRVVLKGDLPIGIFRQSADAWVAPELYNMDGQAGAPPDDFAVNGQNWGFPTYNWERMAEDDYEWWKRRFRHMAHYFDAFRIDHILGFFRIWEIPYEHIDGIMGIFNKSLPIHINEFKNRGIPFDYQRFCQPFITGALIMDAFGKHSNWILDTFLDVVGESRFQLKPAFKTQRQIKTYLEQNPHPEIPGLKRKLFDLVSNVLLFEVKGSDGTLFHPRISLHHTYSFQTLSADNRQKLDALYMDYFYHRQEAFWEEQGIVKLPAIKAATEMLVCGEDLGMVPECVPRVMDSLGILSLEIQRMSKNPKTDFLASEDIPYLSVCSPSTHDMAPLRAWWEEEKPERINRMYYEVLGMTGDRPFYCEPYIVEAILRQHLHFPGMWVIFPLQDILGVDQLLRRKKPSEERINDPSNPDHYWRYRMHLTIEDLLKENSFNSRIKEMVKSAGR